MRVVACDSQTGMTNLAHHEIAGHHVRLHVADPAVPECVHPTGNNSKAFAVRRFGAFQKLAILVRQN
jgi:hypothetical protein